MSIARHHAEWLSLVEASGPFLSLQVLMDAFPQGLEAHNCEQFKVLRQAYEEWLDNRGTPGIHRAWVEWVLSEILAFPEKVLVTGQGIPTSLQVTITEHQVTLRPDWAVIDPTTKQPRLLVQVMPPDQGLEKTLKGSRWKASPATGMMELLHATDVRLGLLTNGEQWMLVNAPRGESTGYISWYSNLWLEEKLTLRAFRNLLGVQQFFGVEENETLEALLTKSKDAQQEVTDQLGLQVRKAVEVLVQALDRIDQDRKRTLLSGISETVLYQAALTVMMRLVFLFSAEERELLLLGDPLYDQFYAVSTLRSQLREQADQYGEELLERRHDAWARLLATFRAVFGGIHHDALQLPAYGGELFDPDRFPFLEGRSLDTHWLKSTAAPIPINNRTVLHLLEALQILQVKVPGGGAEPRKLSFRALDIEQIGHVYEGLLDHTAVRASETILGLAGTKNKEPEVPLSELERLQTKGTEDLIEFLRKETGRSASALRKSLPNDAEANNRTDWASLEMQRLRIACNNDPALFDRVLPWAKLIRIDTFDAPVVIPEGSVFVTEGSDRRETGTHYTPRTLTEEIVKYTLEPLVYSGVAEGKPKEDWQLKSAAELLQLKVCDMAMGSGAFLVQVCRYLSERLVEAWEETERQHPGQVVVAPEGTLSDSRPEECPIPKDADERLAVARRIVADRCLYGVDKNPMAVEMAKLSLWLITLQRNRPFTFLDHALKCGDSLLGVTRAEQIEYLHLNPTEATTYPIASQIWRPILQDAIAKRQELESFSVVDIEDLRRKENLFAAAERAIARLRFVGDYLVGRALAEAGKTADLTTEELIVVSQRIEQELRGEAEAEESREIAALKQSTARMMNLGNPQAQPRNPFHWLLEFPEVFLLGNPHPLAPSPQGEGPGFSAIVGNPPFQGGKKITGAVGTDYRTFLVEHIANGTKGVADLCAYFFLNAARLLQPNGNFGLIATNTIAQGDTREVGLDQLTANGFVIPRAVPSRKWPGSAAIEVANVWLHRGDWQQQSVLDEKPVDGITPFLTVPGKAVGNPHKLVANEGKSFIGSYVLGMGFVMEPEEAQALIDKNPKNAEVLFPYLNGQDLNSNPDQSPSRWVINFKDWPLDADHDDPKKPKGAPYAADYPDCLAIVREKVKPQREPLNKKPYREKWWQFAERCPGLYEVIAGCDRVLCKTRHSPNCAFEFVKTGIVFQESMIVFAIDTYPAFSVLSSSLHENWAWEYGSTLGGHTLRYSPSDVFETFPFPDRTDTLKDIGERYYTHRQTIMQTSQEGLTKTYNRFHDPHETDPDIQTLRDLHLQMDTAVAAAYGWKDLELDHGFHCTKQGLRFTISETARREVLDRLLELNHQRHAEEVAQGLHNKKKGKKTKKKNTQTESTNTVNQGSLFQIEKPAR